MVNTPPTLPPLPTNTVSKSTEEQSTKPKSSMVYYIWGAIIVVLIGVVTGLTTISFLSPTPRLVTQYVSYPVESDTGMHITKVEVSKSIGTDGTASAVTDTFTNKEPNIYVICQLQNAKAGTKIAYTRYINGKYIDAKETVVGSDNSSYFSFNWSLKDATSVHPSGIYMVKLYLDGGLEDAVTYSVQ